MDFIITKQKRNSGKERMILMKVSIVTPSYNQAQYLTMCLRSVGIQSYRNVEHIVVDGGSKDGSLEILETFQTRDSRLHFSSGPDHGQGDAVNKGFSLASGDIVAWINSDDFYFSPTVFEHVVEQFASHPEIDVLYGGMAYVDSGNHLLHVRIPPPFDYSRLTRIAYIGNTNTFYRRKVIESYQVDPDYHFVIDHEYMLRLTKEFRTVRIPHMIACFRVHPQAKTQILSMAQKNIERIRRDSYHNVRLGFCHRLLSYQDRVLYRLNLAYTDFKYLRKWQRHPPYQVFLES